MCWHASCECPCHGIEANTEDAKPAFFPAVLAGTPRSPFSKEKATSPMGKYQDSPLIFSRVSWAPITSPNDTGRRRGSVFDMVQEDQQQYNLTPKKLPNVVLPPISWPLKSTDFEGASSTRRDSAFSQWSEDEEQDEMREKLRASAYLDLVVEVDEYLNPYGKRKSIMESESWPPIQSISSPLQTPRWERDISEFYKRDSLVEGASVSDYDANESGLW
ncbi:uncharacterized protein BCR38DRAFT_415129 [Pseudomassariella vexata]|uniref:Uncharacterized protein n=1 Tax=Pseudomassariella vexata TaxID=1141098 RepID=A0A1Y2D6R4_9PEZI|nr:uncharacterized protein BCR38DRAFT_415129 [Pseudomassariella vexata]ORY54978.1 hypothetical protein BCR38DRAFT_415129 [Pseudomassariella vexata]